MATLGRLTDRTGVEKFGVSLDGIGSADVADVADVTDAAVQTVVESEAANWAD